MPKARERFAEFLDQDSPDRLGILYQTTSVGLGYGRHAPSHRGFSRQGGITGCRATRAPTIAPRPQARRICQPDGPHAWPRKTTSAAGHLPASPQCCPTAAPAARKRTPGGSRSNPRGKRPRIGNGLGPDGREPVGEYRLLRPFDYACRPRLRTRLTQGRQAWPWNPWSSGARDTHPRLATHVYILTPPASTAGSRRRFAHGGTLSYPAGRTCCRAFGGVLEPRYIVGAGPLDQ